MNSQSRSMQMRWEAAHEVPRFRPVYPDQQVVSWAFRDLDRYATPKTKVLDLGCGAGRHAIFFASEGFDAFACDISAVGLRELDTSAQKKGLVIPTHQTPAHNLSNYENGAFDAVLCFAVMYYMALDQAEQMIREVFRILRQGGKLCCVTRNDGDSRLLNATPVGRCTWHINALGSGAPSTLEEDMDMLFFSKRDIEHMFSSFADLCIDRTTYIHKGFANDDWVVTATRPEK
jgi:SAM-dependent methyltransferase